MPHRSLRDMINLGNPDEAIEQLLDMDEEAFDRAVLAWLVGGRVGTEIMRDWDVAERTHDAINRLRQRLRDPELVAELRLAPAAVEILRDVVAEERQAAKQAAHDARVERARDDSLTSRALRRLGQKYPRELVAIKHDIRAQDARRAASARKG